MCFFSKPCFQEMVENEKLTQARTHAFAGKIALTPFFNHAKFLLLAELPFFFQNLTTSAIRKANSRIVLQGKRKTPPSI